MTTRGARARRTTDAVATGAAVTERMDSTLSNDGTAIEQDRNLDPGREARETTRLGCGEVRGREEQRGAACPVRSLRTARPMTITAEIDDRHNAEIVLLGPIRLFFVMTYMMRIGGMSTIRSVGATESEEDV